MNKNEIDYYSHERIVLRKNRHFTSIFNFNISNKLRITEYGKYKE